MDSFFEPLNQGWWLQGAVELAAKKHPKSSISVSLKGNPICGFVPHEWDGSVVKLQARDDIEWSGK